MLIGEALNRPVVSRADWARVGMVREILVDVPRNRVVGYVLDMPISIGQARIVLAEDAAYSGDAVTVASAAVVKYVGQDPVLRALIEGGVGMSGSRVIVGGKTVTLADFAFDQAAHQIVARSDNGKLVEDTLHGKEVGLVRRPVEEYDGPGWDSYARYVYDLDYSSLGL